MRTSIFEDDFDQEIECIYKDELFKVRNNGAVYRCARKGKRMRPNDNQWTFGNANDNTGYMDITSFPIHRIITTAFHGNPPTPMHVVDHIDTNKRNNRSENLRWVTRLENILLNPITAKRIATICGSVEAFLENPALFKDKFPDPNFSWMCTVSTHEAKMSLNRMLIWAQTDDHPPGSMLSESVAYRGLPKYEPDLIPEPNEVTPSKTFNAAQRNWRTPSEFLCCPQEFMENPLNSYFANLKIGSIFCRNDLYTTVIEKSAISEDSHTIFVISEEKDGIKPFGLAKITYEDNLFMHTSFHKYFSREGAEKQFTLVQGLEWTGGDSIDDYC